MDLGGLVARNARMLPDKEALVCEDRRYNWKTVNEKVNAVANTLIRAGLKKGDTVAMWMFNSDWFVFAFYGIVKAGCVAVPVNFRLAQPEAEYIFDNSDAAANFADQTALFWGLFLLKAWPAAHPPFAPPASPPHAPKAAPRGRCRDW